VLEDPGTVAQSRQLVAQSPQLGGMYAERSGAVMAALKLPIDEDAKNDKIVSLYFVLLPTLSTSSF
jgi:hypothetical protein